jgi:glycosyltransferase involved in cell wall biosynthesis
MTDLRVLIVAPSLDGEDVGEVRGTVRWIASLSSLAQVTVLSTSREGMVPLAEQLPHARVVTWPEPRILYQKFERFNAMAKPSWPLFAYQVRRWIVRAKAQGEQFDIAHQMLPQAMRHATPFRGLGIPYVMGPLGGGLETPEAFRSEVKSSTSLSSRLRAFDDFRLRYDTRLRTSYSDAELIIGVGPYISDKLKGIEIRRFYPMHEIARETEMPPEVHRQAEPGKLALFHAGRVIRTKGLRDVIRALSFVKDLPGVTLTSAGEGEDMAACRAEAQRLGVENRITFMGKIPRATVDEEYRKADVFCFPSFREPLGGVLLEALSYGLPIITAARGGPDFVVDDTCGFRIPVTDPEQFPRDIATAIRQLALDPNLRLALGRGGRLRSAGFDNWESKAARLIGLYREVLHDIRELSRD